MQEKKHQHGVLEYLSVVTSVVGMPIIHASLNPAPTVAAALGEVR